MSRADVYINVAILACLLTPGVYPAMVDAMRPSALEQTTFSASADADVFELSPNTNFGGALTLRISPISGQNLRSLVRFNITGIEHVVSATMEIVALSFGGTPASRTYEVHRIAADWNEGNVTWNNQPAVENATLVSTVFDLSVGTPINHTYDVTDIVREWASGTPDYGVRIRDSAEDSGDTTTVYRSRQSVEDPMLIVVWRSSSIGNVDLTGLLGLIAFIVIVTGGVVFIMTFKLRRDS